MNFSLLIISVYSIKIYLLTCFSKLLSYTLYQKWTLHCQLQSVFIYVTYKVHPFPDFSVNLRTFTKLSWKQDLLKIVSQSNTIIYIYYHGVLNPIHTCHQEIQSNPTRLQGGKKWRNNITLTWFWFSIYHIIIVISGGGQRLHSESCNPNY